MVIVTSQNNKAGLNYSASGLGKTNVWIKDDSNYESHRNYKGKLQLLKNFKCMSKKLLLENLYHPLERVFATVVMFQSFNMTFINK